MTKRERPKCLACKSSGTRPKRGEGVRIVFDPRIQFSGTPTIERHMLSAERMASGMYGLGSGADIDNVLDDYGLTREGLIVACWWAAHWGPRKFRKAWREWGELANWHLWYGCVTVPLPPTRAEIEASR